MILGTRWARKSWNVQIEAIYRNLHGPVESLTLIEKSLVEGVYSSKDQEVHSSFLAGVSNFKREKFSWGGYTGGGDGSRDDNSYLWSTHWVVPWEICPLRSPELSLVNSTSEPLFCLSHFSSFIFLLLPQKPVPFCFFHILSLPHPSLSLLLMFILTFSSSLSLALYISLLPSSPPFSPSSSSSSLSCSSPSQLDTSQRDMLSRRTTEALYLHGRLRRSQLSLDSIRLRTNTRRERYGANYTLPLPYVLSLFSTCDMSKGLDPLHSI